MTPVWIAHRHGEGRSEVAATLRRRRHLEACADRPSVRALSVHEPSHTTPTRSVGLSPQQAQRLRAVLQAPEEDGPRLAYADWCDAQRDPARAALIRGQVELARATQPSTMDWLRRSAELEDLVEQHGPRWLAELGDWEIREPWFCRGFIEAGTLSGRCLIAHGEAVLAATPLREVRLVAVTPIIDQLVRQVDLRRFSRLDLRGNRLGVNGLRWLLRGTVYALDGLNLAQNALDDPTWRFFHRVAWPALNELNLADNQLKAFTLPAAALPSLQRLDLSGNPLGDQGLAQLAASGDLDSLAVLGLARTGLTTLPKRPLPRLEQLDLSHNRLANTPAARLPESLQELQLAGCRRTAADLEGWIAGLQPRRLNLRGNRLDAEGLGKLLAQGFLEKCEYLDLSNNPLAEVPCQVWRQLGQLERLTHLRLAGVGLRCTGLRCLLEGLCSRALWELDLSWQALGDEAATWLAQSAGVSALRVLGLRGWALGWQGAEQLAQSSKLTQLRELRLESCPRLLPESAHLLQARFGSRVRLSAAWGSPCQFT